MRSSNWSALALAVVMLAAVGGTVQAQPTLMLSADVVSPGAALTATIAGPPGAFWALIGSSVNAGAAYAGVSLAVGADVVVLGTGVLPSSGQTALTIIPPFVGTILTATTCRRPRRRRPASRRCQCRPGRSCAIVMSRRLSSALLEPWAPSG